MTQDILENMAVPKESPVIEMNEAKRDKLTQLIGEYTVTAARMKASRNFTEKLIGVGDANYLPPEAFGERAIVMSIALFVPQIVIELSTELLIKGKLATWDMGRKLKEKYPNFEIEVFVPAFQRACEIVGMICEEK